MELEIYKIKKYLFQILSKSFLRWYNRNRKRTNLMKGGVFMISVQALCNTVLKRAFSENIPVSPMKLQKLLYFIYREYLRQTGHPLFSEPFETWAYGPVVPSVYDEFKSFRAKPINRFARDSQDNVYVLDENADPELTASIVSVWELYKRKSGIELSQITHKPGSAWYKAYMEGSPVLNFEDIQNDKVY